MITNQQQLSAVPGEAQAEHPILRDFGPSLLGPWTLRGLGFFTDTGTHDPQSKGAAMQRKFFDVFASAIGAVVVVALVVAGSPSHVGLQLRQLQRAQPASGAGHHVPDRG